MICDESSSITLGESVIEVTGHFDAQWFEPSNVELEDVELEDVELEEEDGD